ncbi:hypothetical protein CWI42_080170 [Ordospora colligata]|uniref:Exocyst complex component Sec8 N-terminal domain-containing protein n=1 Tax=Ordospora colligata OC4 TaxID=1354746 RepID=A0A0B2UIZ6_9MICR|nr:uncharacterized protein M896_080170 [Ordospora colligata OC4]KHN69283.1 hypothetical protein M896_080170 [Ordospora colligata OC4]TBU15099.1 hypothetical protein CWI41_080180 [Ordospora colligata]TBU15150.1 hypothetical protein CWI40_080180 [Ordospora colligata]TBU18396.1 hypothetical protein CWI42_080170 [Ordospora colligata]
MDEADALLGELRIDWETLVTDDFNPLKQALRNKNSMVEASNFRNLFHKVEKVMEGIIEKNYKGFSDSVLSYMESYKLNKRCSENISEISKAVQGLLGMKIDVKDMTKEYESMAMYESNNSICNVLVEMRRCFEEFSMIKDEIQCDVKKHDGMYVTSQRFLDATKKASRLYDLIEENGLMEMECVSKFKAEASIEVKEFMTMVYKRLDRFVFYNEYDYQEDFRCVVMLGMLFSLDRYQTNNFEKEYFGMVESIIRSIDGDGGNNKAERLSRAICSRTANVIHNLGVLWEMADASFEGLNGKTLNIRDKASISRRIEADMNAASNQNGLDAMLCMYGPDWQEFVEGVIVKVLKKFVSECVEGIEKYFDTEIFEAEHFADDIDYEAVFEKKYVIYERMVMEGEMEAKSPERFTKVFVSGIDIVIYLEKYVTIESMKRYLWEIINEKYVKEKQKQIRKKIAYLFEEEDWCENDHLNRRLRFYSNYKKCIDEFSIHADLCSIKDVFGFLDGLFERKFDELYRKLFRSDIINTCFLETDENEADMDDTFKKLLLVRAMDINSVYFEKKYYENMLFALDTMKEAISSIDGDKLKSVMNKIEVAIRFQMVLEMLYFFDLFYREGNYRGKDDYYFQKIVKVADDINKCIVKTDMEGVFEFVFDCLNFYIKNNVQRLNVKSMDDLKAFAAKIKLLDEILCLVKGEGSMREAIQFIDGVVLGEEKCDSGMKLKAKLSV